MLTSQRGRYAGAKSTSRRRCAGAGRALREPGDLDCLSLRSTSRKYARGQMTPGRSITAETPSHAPRCARRGPTAARPWAAREVAAKLSAVLAGALHRPTLSEHRGMPGATVLLPLRRWKRRSIGSAHRHPLVVRSGGSSATRRALPWRAALRTPEGDRRVGTGSSSRRWLAAHSSAGCASAGDRCASIDHAFLTLGCALLGAARA